MTLTERLVRANQAIRLMIWVEIFLPVGSKEAIKEIVDQRVQKGNK